MSAVWELDLSQTEKLVLLAFADHADDAGQCWPSLVRVAWKSGLGHRQVQRTVRQLVGKKLLEVAAGKFGGRGTSVTYRVHPEKGVKLAPFDNYRRLFLSRKGGSRDAKRTTCMAEKGDIALSPEPSTTISELVENPSPELTDLLLSLQREFPDQVTGKNLAWAKKLAAGRASKKPWSARFYFQVIPRIFSQLDDEVTEWLSGRGARWMQDQDALPRLPDLIDYLKTLASHQDLPYGHDNRNISVAVERALRLAEEQRRQLTDVQVGAQR